MSYDSYIDIRNVLNWHFMIAYPSFKQFNANFFWRQIEI